MFYTSGPNEALVVSGCCHKTPKLIPGGRVLVWPFVQKLQRINLNLITLTIASPKIYTKEGVPISVTGIAQVKVESKQTEMLHHACQQFLGMSDAQIKSIILQTLEGHQRAIMGTMTVEEIYQDRTKFNEAVFNVASRDLANMGIAVISFTLQSIEDDVKYLSSLGAPSTAEVQRNAKIGRAEAARDSGIRAAAAQQQEQDARFRNKTEVAESERDFAKKKAEFDIQVQTQRAIADMAKELQTAKTEQRIRNEEMGIRLIERQKQIQVMEQEIERNERHLEATVKEPAKAERYRMETLAAATKNKLILEAEARAEAIRAKGDAEAFAINAKAQADADAMAKKAAAWKEYKNAAVVDMVLRTLPKVAAEVAAPLNSASKITMIAGPDGEIGASKLTGEVLDIMARVPETIKRMTGVDLGETIKSSVV